MKSNIYKLRRMNILELLKLAQIGDNEAVGIILEKFEPMVKSICSKYYGSWAEFEDFLQIGFVGLIQAIFNYKNTENTKFSTFAYLNISSEIKSFITYLNRQKNKVLTEAINIENTLEEDSENSEYYLADPETENVESKSFLNFLLEQTIEEMKSDEKEIINLWKCGYSYKDISKILKIKNKKVDNTIQKLKKQLSDVKKTYNKFEDFFGGVL